jgi:hypothetical protein
MWRSLTQGLDTLFQRVQTVLRVYWVKAWSYIPQTGAQILHRWSEAQYWQAIQAAPLI